MICETNEHCSPLMINKMNIDQLLDEFVAAMQPEVRYQEMLDILKEKPTSKPTELPTDQGTIPTTIIIPTTIQQLPNEKLLCGLFDTGGSTTLINRRVLPSGLQLKGNAPTFKATTAAGEVTMTEQVTLQNVLLPEFSRSFQLDAVQAYVFDAPQSQYDVIFGRDILQQMKLDVSYENNTMTWMEQTISLKSPSYWKDMYNLLLHFDTDDVKDQYLAEILPSKYDKVDINEVMKQQSHLQPSQQYDLKNVLSKHTDILFNGKLGKYPKRKVHLELKRDAKPFHSNPYAVPHLHQQLFKDELDRLEQIGVLAKTGGSEWAAGTFIIPKKDGRVRWVTDFRRLNQNLVRKKYPLPRIQDILTRRNGYKYFTKIDISMQYYTFELDEESSHLCVISTPFGPYRYLRLPMGVTIAPDVSQEIMESMFRDLREHVEIYIDDIGVFTNTWEEHIQILEKVLQRLEDNGMTVNPLKCEWAVKETDWLGYWLTPTGLKPWSKKIKSILALKPPTTTKQLRSFIGAVTFYRDMWPHRSHILAPLTELTGGSTFTWTDKQQQAFDAIKAMIAKDTLLQYPDHNLPFNIFTDASDLQLGSVIMQNDRPVAYFSKKLNKAQQNYTTMEKELLSIVETLHEYRTMLFGAHIDIFTDHKNLTHEKLTSQKILRWRLYIEDYGPTFHYIKGSDNILADALSRLPFDETIVKYGRDFSSAGETLDTCIEQDDQFLFDVFLHHPNEDAIPNPLNYQRILQYQQQDEALVQHYQDDERFIMVNPINNIHIIAFQAEADAMPKIVIPHGLLLETVIWYHLTLHHPGMTRLYETITTFFYNPQLKSTIADVTKRCDTCQRNEQQHRGYGKLPPKVATFEPWSNVAVDLIGPWKVESNNIVTNFSALTIIDTDTNLAEACIILQKTSDYIANKFENTWIARYPCPLRCIHDNGGEFIGEPFQRMLRRHNIIDVPTTIKNPQSNAICERMHQTISDMLRTRLYQDRPRNQNELDLMIENALASSIYALRSTIHSTLKMTPGSLAFNYDMLLNVPLQAQVDTIVARRQMIINANNNRENRKRYEYQYHNNDQILIRNDADAKMDSKFRGPFRITHVHDNGTVTIQMRPNVSQRINIRRIKPYFS